MEIDLSLLSIEEIYGLQLKHDRKHGYTFREKETLEEIVHLKGEWTKEFLIGRYEQRTDNWEQHKKRILSQLKLEALVEKIGLIEHERGVVKTRKGKERKKPSLWSASKSQQPSLVEDAAADLYAQQGFSISPAFGMLESIMLRAFCIVLHGDDGHWLYRNSPVAIKHMDHVDTAELDLALTNILPVYVEEYITGLLRGGVLCMEKTQELRDMDDNKRRKVLEDKFCNNIIRGASCIDQLKHEIHKARASWPQSFISRYYTQVTLFGIRSGVPDLFIWKEGTCKFVEVKSPNDRVHHRQAEFYHYVLKPMGEKFHIARVTALSLPQS